MMSLAGPEGQFELEVLGYEFPGITDDVWDSEWLVVAGRASCAKGGWEFRGPCLQTFEVASLASWFRKLHLAGPWREMSFYEPVLRFERVEEPSGDVLLVWLAQEAAPPWATDDEKYGPGFPVRLPFSSVDFSAAAEVLEKMISRFPVRARTL